MNNRYWDPREWRTHSELYLVRSGIEVFSPNALQAFHHPQREPSPRLRRTAASSAEAKVTNANKLVPV